MSRRLGVIDVGSNSLHLLVAELDGADWSAIEVDRSAVRLGSLKEGRIPEAALAAATDAIGEFADRCRALGSSPPLACATAAVRDAINGAELGKRIEPLGVRLQILTGEQEAERVWLGVRRGLALRTERCAVFDLGGRSTELVGAQGARIHHRVSVGLGHLQARDAASTRSELDRMARRLLAPAIDGLGSFEQLIGTAGTALTLGMMAAAARGETPESRHDLRVAPQELRALVDQMEGRSPQSIAELPGADPRRADTLFSGSVAVLALVDMLGAPTMRTSQSGLREGLMEARVRGLKVGA